MNTEKEYYSPRPNVMKFVSWEVQDFNPNWPIVRLMDALEKNPGGIPDDLAKLIPARDSEMIVRSGGWQFDFSPYMKRFLGKVTVWDDDWSETKIHTFYGLSENDVRGWIAERGFQGYDTVNLHWLIPEPEDEL